MSDTEIECFIKSEVPLERIVKDIYDNLVENKWSKVFSFYQLSKCSKNSTF